VPLEEAPEVRHKAAERQVKVRPVGSRRLSRVESMWLTDPALELATGPITHHYVTYSIAS